MLIRIDQAPDERQLTLIAEQLGRTPRGIQAVTAIDGEGTPLALRMHSLVDDAPFPTLYWLCSERLKIELSHLEADGVIKALEAHLLEDPALLADYHRSHEAYVADRWRYMDEATRVRIEELGFESPLRERGVGGISNWNQVRCLHTQYAHHLSTDNAIGRWIDAHYPQVAASLP
ncbi:DUF501 domain-containing protein [Halotalea alkalilenta]|uniref:DUF501 domain-containing protein n=1 Tax=Halotalea alkalilenta TaxID=376489 RepID=A0A172YCV0_9GAMM|nr:DUF501 domain-containing protein [Halotalea alkalilenta]ANF56922.1 hypothetical protein A5892_05115 [Halotalea alkalilenta]